MRLTKKAFLIFRLLVFVLILAVPYCGFSQANSKYATREVIYHIFQRSFFDSDGDNIGDLNGIKTKLNYLQELGVTSILLLPLYESVYYHNYFSSNFEKIDPEFGTEKDFIILVKELHRRKMKIYMDMETQYVTEDHLWYRDSYKNPKSKYSDYLVYNGPGNTKPETIVYDLTELKGYDGVTRKITTVNLNSPKVFDYNYKLFRHWIDPNNDGKFDDGVDGFRLDHMMDDLDNKGKWKNLFANFWSPLINKLEMVNPNISFFAEQANWGSFGMDYLEKGSVDKVFSFRPAFEIRNLNKPKLELVLDSALSGMEYSQLVFIENHDMARFATVVKSDPGKLKLGAALNLLIGGTPIIYYGQELGMTGAGGWMKYGMTDANEISEREAFEWYRSDTGKGMAIWYKNSGPWWDSTNLKSNDGISLEEQRQDTGSLFNWYKKLIALRKTYPALTLGSYIPLKNSSDSIFTFARAVGDEIALVAMNFSGVSREFKCSLDLSTVNAQGLRTLLGSALRSENGSDYLAPLPPFGVAVWTYKLKPSTR